MPPKSQILDPATGLPVNVAGRYDSPYEEAYGKSFQAALGMLRRPSLEAGQRATEGAEGQMWQALGQQQQLAQAQAQRRGFDPSAARAASQASGEMMSQGYGMAQQLRAQEEAARRQQMLDLYRQRSQFDVQGQQMATQRMGQELAQQDWQRQTQQQLNDIERQNQESIFQGILGAGTGALSLLSDERVKRGIRPVGRSLDAMMGTLGSYGNK